MCCCASPQLKERLGREAEEAVEKERAAAATRLREVSERYEQQLQVGTSSGLRAPME